MLVFREYHAGGTVGSRYFDRHFCIIFAIFQHQYNKVGNTKLVTKYHKITSRENNGWFHLFCPDLPAGSFAVLENNNKVFTTYGGFYCGKFTLVGFRGKNQQNRQFQATWDLKKHENIGEINLTITILLGCPPSLRWQLKVYRNSGMPC